MEWVEIIVESCPENEDYIQNVLYDAGATGLAIEDPNDIIELSKSQSDWDFIDLELLELDKDVLTIKAYFEQTQGIEEKIAYIRKNIPNCIVNVNQIDPSEWEESYKKYYKPFKIG
jgi:ribosomal protein L11 methyltransferase